MVFDEKKNHRIPGIFAVFRCIQWYFANINGFSMMVFIILMALLTHGHGMSFQDRCLGFPKRPCFPKFMKMVAHGAPVTDGLDEFRSLRSEDTKRYKNLE